jgi:long-chain acyl-CoA synthetase
MSERHTLGRLTEEFWARTDDYESLCFEGTWHRSHDLAARARRIAGGFQALGIGPGDRVAVMMANCPEVPLTYWALWRGGAVVTPVVFLASHEELRHILVNSGARAIVTTPEVLLTVQLATAELDVRVIVVGDAPDGTMAYAELETADEGPLVDRRDDDLAALMYTGGTTGRAKGVMLTQAGLYNISRASREATAVTGLTRTLMPLPMSHAYGLIVTLVGMQGTEAGTSVLMRWFDPAAWLALAAEHRVQVAPLVPAMVQLLLTQPLEETSLPDLTYVTCGAAPLPRDAMEEFERRVPGVQILEGYGLTETSAVTSVNRPGARKPGSVGLPLPGYEITVRDDAGEALPAGTDGEICVRGASLMKGYWPAGGPASDGGSGSGPGTGSGALPAGGSGGAATGQGTTALVDGELRTGDIGHFDDDGYLYIVDRKKDLIIRGGFNVFPRDVEDALAEHPDVTMAGVVGRPDPSKGEEIVAFVSLRPGAEITEAELVAWTKEQLGAIKYPREIHFVDQVPVTSVFKTDRKKLRTMLAEMTEDPA